MIFGSDLGTGQYPLFQGVLVGLTRVPCDARLGQLNGQIKIDQ